MGVTVTYTCSVGFVYFAIQIDWSHPSWTLWWTFFFYRLSRFHQNLCHQTNTHHVGKLTKSNQIKVNIKSRTEIMWNADILLTNLLKIACTTLSSFQMLNQIAEFNSWKLISARWIRHQHNINAIITYSI